MRKNNILIKDYLKLLPKFKEEKTYLVTYIIFTLFSLSFFGILAINPTLSTIIQLKKELADSLYVDKKLDEKITNLGILQQKYNLLENDLPLPLTAIPKNPEAAILIGKLKQLAKKANFTITQAQSFQVELTKHDNLLNNVSSFAFSIEGEAKNYEDITDFLFLLSNFDRIITIDTASLNGNYGKNNLFKVGIRGKAYFKN